MKKWSELSPKEKREKIDKIFLEAQESKAFKYFKENEGKVNIVDSYISIYQNEDIDFFWKYKKLPNMSTIIGTAFKIDSNENKDSNTYRTNTEIIDSIHVRNYYGIFHSKILFAYEDGEFFDVKNSILVDENLQARKVKPEEIEDLTEYLQNFKSIKKQSDIKQNDDNEEDDDEEESYNSHKSKIAYDDENYVMNILMYGDSDLLGY